MAILYDLFLAPFADFAFMRRALLGCILLSLGATPLGVLLLLRRMSLMGEAMSHAVLPGIAIGFLVWGLSLPAMGLGGLCAGLVIVILVGFASRFSDLKEDAHLAAFYVIALALGVLLISLHGTPIDLAHILFGTVLAIDAASLRFMAIATSVTLIAFALFYRPLILDAFDPIFLRSVSRSGAFFHLFFLILVVLNLVASFQALGTLMAVGLMILPAASSRFWAESFLGIICCAVGTGIVTSIAGLLFSYHLNVPSGPAITLVAGLLYISSLLLGKRGSVRARYFPTRHLTTGTS